MKILFVSSEVEPFSKVGGLGDVVSALSREMAKLGHEVKVLSPLYGSVKLGDDVIVYDQPMIVNMGHGIEFCQLIEKKTDGVSFYFIKFDKYFSKIGVYGENGNGYDDNWKRFVFLSRSAIDFCEYLQWTPDVIHSHDWPTALVNVYAKTTSNKHLGNVKTVYTIHNMAHHGASPREILKFADLPEHLFHPFALESLGFVNLMKGGLLFADKITTVSSSYANEIKTPEFGCGLDDILRYRAADLVGICNGIDVKMWDPATDQFIAKNFSIKSMAGKSVCKSKLQSELGLNIAANVPLYAVISRFYEQKGLDILCDILPQIMATMAVQFVILGAGEGDLEYKFSEMQKWFPGRVSTTIGYNNALSHKIEAGADFFVMPSRYEPCGLNQMYSSRYGTVPIVRATGGLKDTVENYNEAAATGTGFVFNDLTHSALYNTMGWSCATYYDRYEHIKKLQFSGMKKDFSWKKSAEKYSKIY